MNRTAWLALAALFLIGATAATPQTPSTGAPAYTEDGQLVFPSDYRDWAFVTSGLGMSYAPPMPGMNMSSTFDNVFVPLAALRAFRETGRWPDPTIFVKEVRGSHGHASINRSGHFQAELLGFDVEVKDSHRPQTWQYYGFAPQAASTRRTADAIPGGDGCIACHGKSAAVEHTFVQFYPTLFPIAKAKGTVNPSFRDR